MTQNQARKLIKIGKILLIALFAIFFVILSIQGVKINKLKDKQTSLQNELNNKTTINTTINSQIEEIENNFDIFSEEELRKEGFVKENETRVESKK